MSRFYKAKQDEVVWKKIRTIDDKDFIVECLLPAGTKYFGGKKGKNRAEKLVPIAFYESVHRGCNYLYSCSELKLSTRKIVKHVGFYSAHSLTYILGKVAKPHYFDDDPDVCTGGIHFWFKPKKALSWS